MAAFDLGMKRAVLILFAACSQKSSSPPPPPPPVPPPIVPAIDAGVPSARGSISASDHACARTRAAGVSCWGLMSSSDVVLRPQVIAGVEHVVGVAVGLDDACAWLEDGGVTCWAAREADRAPHRIAHLDHVVEVAGDSDTLCARRSDGHVACWWRDPTVPSLSEAHDIAGLDDAVELAVGNHTACARRKTGDVACWSGVTPDHLETIAAARGAISIGGRSSNFAAVLPGGHVVGWVGATTAAWRLPALPGDVTRIVVGTDQVCALGHAVTCFEPAGNGDPDTAPHVMAGLDGATELTVGSGLGCARTATGEARCWGYVNRVGIGAPLTTREPTLVAQLDDAVQLAGTASAICARRANGHVACWGEPLTAAANPNSSRRRSLRVPTEVAGIDRATDLAMVSDEACVRAAGKTWCWGYDGKRWLTSPTAVASPGVSFGPPQSFGGGYQRLAWSCLRHGAKLACMRHFSGRHGDDSEDVPDPTLSALTDVVDLVLPSQGFDAATVLHSDGTVASDREGEGNSQFKRVAGVDGVVEIAPGIGPDGLGRESEICGVQRSGAVTCWTSNEKVRTVAGITDAIHIIGAEEGYFCVVHKTGSVSCWGDRELLGNTLGNQVETPTAVDGI